MHDQLRQVIRSLIEQELSAFRNVSESSSTRNQFATGNTAGQPVMKPAVVKDEQVSLTNNEELAQFVARILTLSDDPVSRAALTSGQHRFRLTGTEDSLNHSVRKAIHQSRSTQGDMGRFEHGVLTERACSGLSPDINELVIGKTVRVTPLAADWLRRKRITIKRGDT